MKKAIIGFMVVALLMTGLTAFAQTDIASTTDTTDTDTNFRDLMARLRATHQDLKAQVDAGKITKEEARVKWIEMITDVQAKKEAHYNDRIAKAKDRIEKIAEKNPEKAAELQERIDAIAEHRASLKIERESIAEQVRNGEISREEAHRLRAEILREQAERKSRAEAQRAERKAKMEEQRASRVDRNQGESADSQLQQTDLAQ